jgi:hypothetical protein
MSSGRPSLLSSEQQAEADRHRILSGLDSKSEATTGAKRARRGKLTWVAAGVAVLAIGAGSAVWLAGEGEKEIVLAGTAPLPSTAAPAAALASEPPVVPPEPEEVSTAAILEDTPPGAAKAAPAADKKPADDELSKLLEPPAGAPAHVAAHAAPKKPVVVAKAAHAKAAAKPHTQTAMTMNVEPVLKKKKPVAHPKAFVQTDSDVALLAALVAHSKATQPKRPTGIGAKLLQCKTLGSVAEAEQCRAHLCAGSAKNDSECKAPPNLAKASPEA